MPNRWRDWLAQAEHDLGQAEASHRDGRHDWSCFAAHQSAKKAVKALHQSSGRLPGTRPCPHSHRLRP